MLGNLEGRDNKGNGVLHKIMNHNGHENDAGPKKKTNKNGQGQGEYEGGSTTYKGKPFTKLSFNDDDPPKSNGRWVVVEGKIPNKSINKT